MPVKHTCPKCNWTITVADRNLGKRGRCPECETPFRIRKKLSFKFWAKRSGAVDYRRLYWFGVATGVVCILSMLAIDLFAPESLDAGVKGRAAGILACLTYISFGIAITCSALGKGRSPWWALFGIFNVFGLLVSANLEDHTVVEDEVEAKLKRRVLAERRETVKQTRKTAKALRDAGVLHDNDSGDVRCPRCGKGRAVRNIHYDFSGGQTHEKTAEQYAYICIHCSPTVCMAENCQKQAARIIRHRMPAGRPVLPLFDVVNPRNDCWACSRHAGIDFPAQCLEHLGRAAFIAAIVLVILWQQRVSDLHGWIALGCFVAYLVAWWSSLTLRSKYPKKHKFANKVTHTRAGTARTLIDHRF